MNNLKSFDNFINEEYSIFGYDVRKYGKNDNVAEKIYNYIIKNPKFEFDAYRGTYNNYRYVFRINKKPKIEISEHDPYGEEDWNELDDRKSHVDVCVERDEGMFGTKNYSVYLDREYLEVSNKVAKKLYQEISKILKMRFEDEKKNRKRISEEEIGRSAKVLDDL